MQNVIYELLTDMSTRQNQSEEKSASVDLCLANIQVGDINCIRNDEDDDDDDNKDDKDDD